MAITWIYVFADSGHDTGVKVGRSSTAFGAWNDAPCYSPRAMTYVAGWQQDLPDEAGKTRAAAANALERRLHALLIPRLTFPRNGREWFDIAPAEAVDRISGALGAAPTVVDGHRGRRVANDQLRNPHPRRLNAHKWKIVAWIYREHLTGRLKTQVIDDWAAPFEMRRRYSRNGFAEVAAFSYGGAPTAAGNARVYGAWSGVMTAFGPGTDDTVYGWLSSGTDLDHVVDAFRSTGLTSLPLDRRACPIGVRAAYNKTP
jgi:hypothetical protein